MGESVFVPYKNVFNNIEVDMDHLSPVRIKKDEKQQVIRRGDVLFTASSETPEECGMSSVVTVEPSHPVYVNSFCFIWRPNETANRRLLPAYLKYALRSKGVRKQISRTAFGVTRYNISKKLFLKTTIPVPPIEVQERIVAILDRFDALTTSLTDGLPAEIEARRKQYEYYRDKLLDFPRKESA